MTGNQLCDFSEHYECSALPAVKALERDVLGCDYGGTSWTTLGQAAQIISSLDLDSGSRLLEVGCGSGWPGLYLSAESGCDVTLLDMPINALELAAERAASDDMIGRTSIVNGSGTALPFVDESFNRLSHSDVLCCLPEKLEMLKECRRVATPDAKMHFSAIEPAAGLSADDLRRTVDTGPPFVGVPEGYRRLLGESGWQVEDRIDVSEEYGHSLEKLASGLKRNTAELQEAFGMQELRDLWQHREDQLNLVSADMLQRYVYVVRALAVVSAKTA